ncbi:MAG: Crp/Fnr family transcriptional regulator [Caldilineaceae bacterium]
MSEPQTTAADLTKALQQLPFFQGLDAQLIRRIAQSAIRRVYEPGAIIFLEGDDSLGLYYVQSGWVKAVSMSAEGREQILHFLQAGEVFGGMTVFVRQPMPATAIALEPTELWLLPRDVVRQTLLDVPEFAVRVIEFMGERIQALVTLVADLSLRSVTARLAPASGKRRR